MSNDKTVAMFPGEDGHRRGTENSDKRRCMGLSLIHISEPTRPY